MENSKSPSRHSKTPSGESQYFFAKHLSSVDVLLIYTLHTSMSVSCCNWQYTSVFFTQKQFQVTFTCWVTREDQCHVKCKIPSGEIKCYTLWLHTGWNTHVTIDPFWKLDLFCACTKVLRIPMMLTLRCVEAITFVPYSIKTFSLVLERNVKNMELISSFTNKGKLVKWVHCLVIY